MCPFRRLYYLFKRLYNLGEILHYLRKGIYLLFDLRQEIGGIGNDFWHEVCEILGNRVSSRRI